MSELMSKVKTINSAVRTVLATVVLGGIGYGGFLGYQHYVQPSLEAKKAIAELKSLQTAFDLQAQTLSDTQTSLTEKTQALNEAIIENEKLNTRLKLLKVDRRVANVEVLDTYESEDGRPEMIVRFTEVDEAGQPVGASRDFTLAGNKMYVDCWTVSFEDDYVEQADELRGASLCVFKSIFGDIDGPNGAMSLDQETQESPVPGIYRDEKKNAFEQKIWSDFWNVCNDMQRQQELGIRASYGDAIYVQVVKGQVYQIKLRSSGIVSLTPLPKEQNVSHEGSD